MALDPRIKRTSITSNLSDISITDISGNNGDIVYVTDDGETYTQTTNTWGYGLGNPLKTDIAKIFIAEYKSSNGSKYLTPSDYAPASDEFLTVNFPYEKDGWYRFYYVGVPLYDPNEAELNGLIRFFNDNTTQPYGGTVRIFNNSKWTELTPKEIITVHLDSIEITKFIDDFFPYKADQKQAKLHRESSFDMIKKGYGKCPNDEVEQQLLFLSEISFAAFHSGHMPEAQRLIEIASGIRV
jgi:hypothetical protein